MRPTSLIAVVLFLAVVPLGAQAQQRMQEREQEFLETKPLIGESLPEVTIYSLDGSPFETSDLRGHYTVLTFGCLTCPPSIWNIAGLEAVERDYGSKGVRFFFVFKALAHPELAGNHVQPFTLEERLALARQAQERFGTQIPWLVDAMDNRFKHAMGDRPNSQFLIDPNGVIVNKRAWANAEQVRADLEELVGPSDQVTREEDLNLNLGSPPESSAPRGVVERIARPRMIPIVVEPQIESDGLPFFAKLRAEVDAEVLEGKPGNMYFGFHLDPLHDAHWNNLDRPLSFSIASVDGLDFDRLEASAERVDVPSDADPREFMIAVRSWPQDQPLRLTVTYLACVGTETCHEVRQEYVVRRARDADGGGARGEGAGFWDPEDFAKQMLRGDRDGDGRLVPSEVVGIALPHFDELDANKDGVLVHEELLTIADWLNHRHMPGPPPAPTAPDR